MTFLDFFAGIGGFRRGMEQAGHKCVGFCEYDKFAVASYTSMHLITEEQRQYLATLDLKERQKEILKEEYRNGEWYANDIRTVNAGDIPKADCWCFGFPCQDISVAGKQVGFYGNRSSLFFRVMYLLGQQAEEKRPTYLFIENVKNLLSVNGGWDFARLLAEMDRNGYDAEWQVLNSKNFGVPQNRERCFIIGHLRGRSSAEVFPVEGADGTDYIQRINQIGKDGTKKRENPQTYRVYEADGISPTLTDMAGGGREPYIDVGIDVIANTKEAKVQDRTRILSGGGHLTMPPQHGLQGSCESGIECVGNTNPSGNGMNGNCYFSEGVNPTLTCNKNEGNKVAIPVDDLPTAPGFNQRNVVHDCDGISRTVFGSGHSGNEPKVAIPVLTPDRTVKRQNGRRFKEDGEDAFTLTGQDRHGVAISIEDFYQNRPVRMYNQESPTLRSDRYGLKVGVEIKVDVDSRGADDE